MPGRWRRGSHRPSTPWHGLGETCSADYQVAPNGIQRATVSPDGQHVAYTATALFQAVGCSTVVNVYTSYVVGRTGSAAVHLADIQAIDASEVGGWSGNATILLSNSAFDDTKLYTVSIPANHATAWKSNTDEWDQAWEGPSRGGTLLATDGYSDAAAGQVVRLWNAPSLTSAPTVRCEIAATAGTSNPNVSGFPIAWPVSVAPSGTAVTWQEVNGDSSLNTPDEGIYVTTVPSTGCPTTKSLIAVGDGWPFWGSAAVTATGPVNTPPVVTVTAKPGAYLHATSTSISYTTHDATDYTFTTTCTLDGHSTACGSPKVTDRAGPGQAHVRDHCHGPRGRQGQRHGLLDGRHRAAHSLGDRAGGRHPRHQRRLPLERRRRRVRRRRLRR